MSSSNSKKIVLSKTADWDLWLHFVESRAAALKVWHLINPNTIPKPSPITSPVPPVMPANPTEAIIAAQTALLFNYKLQLPLYQAEQRNLADMVLYIQETISADVANYLMHAGHDPYDMLVTLKENLAPSTQGRMRDVQKEYQKLCKGPKAQNLEKWTDEWQRIYSTARQMNMLEAVGDRPIYDFVQAVRPLYSGFSDIYTHQLNTNLPDTLQMPKVIEQFRLWVKSVGDTKASKNHSAFATDESSSSANAANKRPSFRGKPLPKCLCELFHWWSECFYLNPDKRPDDWKPNPFIQKKVDEALKDPEIKKRVDEAIKKAREWEQQRAESQTITTSTSSSASASTPTESSLGAFPVSNAFASGYPLRASWIYDSGANIHVCNRHMLHRFVKEKDGTGETIIAGAHRHEIEAYGYVEVSVEGDEGIKRKMTLLNVHYIPDFMINIISGFILHTKKVFFDSEHHRLHHLGKTFGYTKTLHGNFVIEYNEPQSHLTSESDSDDNDPTIANAVATKIASSKDWHQILAHAGPETIQQLPNAAEGIKISDTLPAPKTNECETCALSKAHQLISRSSIKSESSDKPFHRITYDLIPLSPALNRHRWVSHFACSYLDFNMVFTHAHKYEAPEIVRKALNIIHTRFNGKVVFFRSDGETSLGKEFEDMVSAMGITYEASSAYTPQQNGHSERKGGILTIKARAMRIGANLPNYLWPWIYQAAGFIMNRTPMKKHNWKTPYEMIIQKKPNLSHMHIYGSKAFPLDKSIPRNMKLQERAHIGFLLGYDSTNIFLIWIPSKRKVIRTRDVIFMESAYYDPSEPDLAQLIEEPMKDTTFDIPRRDIISKIIEIESDDDEKDVIPTNSENANSEKDKDGEPSPNTQNQLQTPGSTPTPDINTLESTPTLQGSPPLTATDVTGTNATIPEASKRLGKFVPRPTAPKDIKGDVEESNILPEGVSRKRLRKQAHIAALDSAISGKIDAFHQSFFTFSAARQYYSSKPTIFTASTTENDDVASPDPNLNSTASTNPNPTLTSRHHRDNMPAEPQNYRQMKNHQHAAGFAQAMKVELDQLQAKGVWKVVPKKEALQSGRNSIPLTWVFKYKFDEEGYLTKYKARLCARGDLQETQQNTYAATLAIGIFRALMAIVAAFDLETRQYDALNAFINSELDEPTYCHPPEGWEGSTGDIALLLLRALYGLKQSPALWYKHLSSTLSDLGLEPVPGIECIFTNEFMILFFFVDDIAVLYHRKDTKHVDEFQAKFFQAYEMRYLGELQWFLGIRIDRDRSTRSLSLCQDSYIDKILTKFKIDTSIRNPRSPIPYFEKLFKNPDQSSAEDILLYQQMVGSINFAAVVTRPDISYATSKLSEYLTNPAIQHLNAAKQLLLYLHHTKHYSISFNPNLDDPKTIFLGSSDASYADDVNTRHSSQGYCFRLFGGMIDWKATKQKTVTTSSTEAELLAISQAAKEFLWWSRFFESINFNVGNPSHIQCDNIQTIRAFTNQTGQFSTKLRHVDVHRHWMRQEVNKGTININWTPSAATIADGLTKVLPPQRHQLFVSQLGLDRQKKDS